MNLPKNLIRLFLGQRLPTFAGELKIPGITNLITIHRDNFGVPYIRAKSERDAWYGLGFCQGQDRGFQLEILLRVTRGTLSEIIGEDTLQIDRLSRRIGFYRSAQKHASLLSGEGIDFYEAFAQGINDGVTYGCSKPPHEFALLRTKPTSWTVTDVLAGLNYIGFGLSSWTAKISRLLLFEKVGPEALKDLDDDYAHWQPISSQPGVHAGEAVDHLGDDLERLMGYFGSGASNNWAMTSAHTSTGHPLLANDPHLAPALPAPWYLAHLYFPGLTLCGASFVGAPIIPSGFNGHMAWGVTAGLVDNIDIYYEQIGEDGESVRQGDGFVSCEILKETYQVKGQSPVEDKILVTPRGPIISDVLEALDVGVSMQATWMSPRPVDGLTTIHHARTNEELLEAGRILKLASLNLVFAKPDETIGWMLTGEAPQRKAGWGTVALPGWEESAEWQTEFVPWEQMPKAVNPEAGYVATANNKPTLDGESPYLGRDWVDGYRVARILELLKSKSDWDLEATKKMQTDRFVIPWREMKEIVLSVELKDKDSLLAQKLLSEWDGITSADSNAAAVYEYFVLEMLHRMARARAKSYANWALGEGFHPLFPRSYFILREVSTLVQKLKEKPVGWFEDGWDAEIEAALAGAVVRLKEHFGTSPEQWTWGEVHELILRHPIGSRSPLDKVFNRGPYPYGGDHHTIAQAGRLSTEFGSNVVGIANLRMAVNVGAWWDNYFVLAGGQSGNPFSPNYDDLLQYWFRGEAVTLAWRGHDISRATEHILELVPDV